MNCHVMIMHSLHTRYMLIRYTVASVLRTFHTLFICLFHGTHPSQHVAVPAPNLFVIRSYQLYVCFVNSLSVYYSLHFVKFCQI